VPREIRGRPVEAHRLNRWGTLPAMDHVGSLVVAVIGQGALTFDLSIPCEVFGLDRSDIAAPWYEFRLVAEAPGPVRTVDRLHHPHAVRPRRRGPGRDRDRAGWSDPDHRASPALMAKLTAAGSAGPGWCRCAPGRSCWPTRAAGRARRDDPLDVRRAAAGPGAPRHHRRPGALPGRPGRVHLGRHGGRDRPVHAPGPPRLRAGGGERGGPAAS
jgi:hypothetical protein